MFSINSWVSGLDSKIIKYSTELSSISHSAKKSLSQRCNDAAAALSSIVGGVRKSLQPYDRKLLYLALASASTATAFLGYRYFTATCSSGMVGKISGHLKLNDTAEAFFETSTTFKLVLPNGIVLEGDLSNGAEPAKIKKITRADGSSYEGECSNGAFNGKGKFTFPNGDVYVGDFIENAMTGKGKHTFSNGVYEGAFVNGKKSGMGKLILNTGEVYEGDFLNDAMTGKGKFTGSEGIVYEGDFLNNEITGKGKYTYPDGRVIEGHFSQGTLICTEP